jgi:hypothetical protein
MAHEDDARQAAARRARVSHAAQGAALTAAGRS